MYQSGRGILAWECICVCVTVEANTTCLVRFFNTLWFQLTYKPPSNPTPGSKKSGGHKGFRVYTGNLIFIWEKDKNNVFECLTSTTYLNFFHTMDEALLCGYSTPAFYKEGLQFDSRREVQRITTQQTQVHLRLSWGSDRGSDCSNIELGGLTWALLYVPIMCMHRGAHPKVSLRWQELRYICREWLKIF